MKKMNAAFWIGLVIVTGLLFAVLFPSLVVQSNPYGTEGLRAWVDEADQFHLMAPPYAPEPGMPFGSDKMGRDILALIVYGSRLTLLLSVAVVVARFLIALPLGISAGFGSIIPKAIIQQFAVIFSAIPALLISIIVLNMSFFVQLEKGASILAFVAVLTAVGWGKLGLIISERVEMIRQEPFVAGDIAIGKNRLQIILTTVLPHLLPELVVLFFMEMARALSMLMQLGLFSVFVGNTKFIEDTDMGTTKFMNLSYEPEWSSILGTARSDAYSSPWMVIFPALAFFISVLGLNLLGEGLRAHLQGLSQSVNRFSDGLFKFTKKRLVTVAIFCVLLLTFSAMTMHWPLSFAAGNSFPEAFTLEEGPVVIGTENAERAAAYLADALEGLGAKPLKSERLIHPYKTQEAHYPHRSNVSLVKGQTSEQLIEGLDYTVMSFGNYAVEALLLDLSELDLFNIPKHLSGDIVKGKALILESRYYTEEAIQHATKQLIEDFGVAAILWKADLETLRVQEMGNLSYESPVMYVDRALIERAEYGASLLKFEMESRVTSGDGNNVIGYWPGNDPKVKEEAILYGFSYNALDPEQAREKIAFALEMIQQLRAQPASQNRTMIVAFFDGTLHNEFMGQRAYVAEVPYEQKKQLLFIDMTRMDGITEGEFLYSAEQSPISRYYAYSFARQMVDKLENEKAKWVELDPVLEEDMHLFLEQGTPTLIFGLHPGGDSETHRDDIGRWILETMTYNNY